MIHLRRVLVPLLVLAVIPACAKKHPLSEPPPPGVVVAGPAEDGAIPPPRPVPPAAEPSAAEDAMEVFVVAGGNGLWKVQYPQGQRLLLGGTEEERASGRLVLPLNRPVKFTCIAEKDAAVFEVPAFPVAIEVKTGQYTQGQVRPIRTGEFGVWRGRERVGSVVVVPAAEFESWLQGTGPLHREEPVDGSLAHTGRQLFLKLNCIKCHSGKADAQAPNLEGLFGRKEKLKGGETVVVDEQYIVESIRKPKAKVVQGWEPIMPAYEKDVVSEEEVLALVAYIKSLKPGGLKVKEERFPPPVGAPTERPVPPEVAPPPREK